MWPKLSTCMIYDKWRKKNKKHEFISDSGYITSIKVVSAGWGIAGISGGQLPIIWFVSASSEISSTPTVNG